MPVIFASKPQRLKPGDIILTRINLRDPSLAAHIVVAGITRSNFVHATMIVPRGDRDGEWLEWSTGPGKPSLRKQATDVECWAYRINDPHWREIGNAAGTWLLERIPTTDRYDWEGAGFVGIQALIGIQHRKPWKNAIPFCFEGVTDACVEVGHDIVPALEAGAVLGADIAKSKMLARL